MCGAVNVTETLVEPKVAEISAGTCFHFRSTAAACVPAFREVQPLLSPAVPEGGSGSSTSLSERGGVVDSGAAVITQVCPGIIAAPTTAGNRFVFSRLMIRSRRGRSR